MDTPKLLIATSNHGKLAEYRALLAGLPVQIIGLSDMPQGSPTVVENRDTFEGNAKKKASVLGVWAGIATLADDSGLEVEALDGAPGVYSARFAGEQATDTENNHKLLEELGDTPENERGARFVCALAFVDPSGPQGLFAHVELGHCAGRIATQTQGAEGFGYDPLFIPEGHTNTFAQMPADQKEKLSHRGAAAEKMKAFLLNYFK